MITAFRQKVTVRRGGVINLRSQKLKTGATAEVIVLVESEAQDDAQRMTAADLLKSGMVGMWADRKDIGDSLEFARSLRKRAEKRGE